MYLMIDNYDSFVYNLRAYFEEAGHEILVVENDGITTGQIRQMKPEGIIISPGEDTEGCGHFSRGDPKVCR